MNLGILVFMGSIAPCFPSAHITGGNNAQCLSSNGKDHEQQPSTICLAKHIIADFILRMSAVIRDEQGAIEKDLFAFGLGNAMFDEILLDIAWIPLKFRAAKENFLRIIHLLCI